MSEQPAHVVMFSSGAASYMAARRVTDQHDPHTVTLLFTDVKGRNPSPHAGEDEDNYRFLRESAEDLAPARLAWLGGDEDIWDVFRRRRRIGSGYAANCSYELKQRPAREWLVENCPDPERTTVYVGIDWTEEDRKPTVVRKYAPYRVEFPMMEPPLMDKEQMLAEIRARGIETPRLYRAGFPHANCGGFCVKAGKAQFALLLREHPERYRYHEEQEQRTREHLGKDVSILNDQRHGQTVPLTMRRFREQIEAQTALFDPLDYGGCGCFIDDMPDETMEATG